MKLRSAWLAVVLIGCRGGGAADQGPRRAAQLARRVHPQVAAVAAPLPRDCPSGAYADVELISYPRLAALAGAPPPSGPEASPIAVAGYGALDFVPAPGEPAARPTDLAKRLPGLKYVAVLRTRELLEPRQMGPASYEGGAVSGAVILVRLADATAVCEMPVSAQSQDAIRTANPTAEAIVGQLRDDYGKAARDALARSFPLAR